MTKIMVRNMINRKLAFRTFTLIYLMIFIFDIPACYSSQTSIYVAPSTITATVGQTFVVSINVSEVIDLYGWEFKLKWNSTILDLLNVTEEDFLKSGGDTYFNSKNKTEGTTGYLLAYCTLTGSIPGVNGSGTLAIVEFKVESAGESDLDLYDTKLVNSLEQPIAHTSNDGYVTTSKSVGGVWIPVNKFGLLAPYIGVASAIVVATVAAAVYVKRVKRRKKKQQI